ncbi:pre-mRNA-processing factor 19 [Cladophialophora psammophila CBS 110553]|uniref:Pre-mRNA-processing factor 19 n=1 Tax=Cladophialophora psammophila CBS 110553 TaxID=1182543 RepID=W9WYK3_9EURO|nr:pre-mRNA-processing factor 19 [Cladophialophora psammophila CBS 110553]EXJ63324.1 pre-mRNA-processing factor 19 [Cladophialophora psammophila CBS 110553]
MTVSGEAPQVPVASRKSGNVYEKRLIEAYISENGTEPTTGESLSVEDLIDLKSPNVVYPRPPQMTSIPAMLSFFQNEWDALALQTYTLQQNLHQARQELSTALYENDAAVRVIAQLTKERDEARATLAQINVGRAAAASTNGDAMQVDSAPLPQVIVEKIESVQQSLSKTRRKRPVPEDWATPDSISAYTSTSTSKPLFPGGTVLAVHEAGDMVLVAGNKAGVYSLSEHTLSYALDVGEGTVTNGLWAHDRAVVATSAGAVKVFDKDQEVSSFSVHAGRANAVALHPSGTILASVGEDKTYIVFDLESNRVLTQVLSNSSLRCAQFHPDGHLLAAGGADGQIKIFDVKSGAEAATFDLGGPVQCIFFSENGTWLAGVTEKSSTISIWDLRKATEITTLKTAGQIDSISWDYTGQFLAAAGQGGVTVEHYSKTSKEWSEILKRETPATRIAWGTQAQSLVTVDEDGVITTLAAAAATDA